MVEVRRDPAPANDGTLFYFRINGVPVYAKVRWRETAIEDRGKGVCVCLVSGQSLRQPIGTREKEREREREREVQNATKEKYQGGRR